jgi:hypothetical protein
MSVIRVEKSVTSLGTGQDRRHSLPPKVSLVLERSTVGGAAIFGQTAIGNGFEPVEVNPSRGCVRMLRDQLFQMGAQGPVM